MSNFKLILVLWFMVFSLYIIFYIPSTTYAHEEIGIAQIYPSSPIYFLKVFRENLEIKFAKTSQEKMSKNLEFASSRLEEVNSLVSNKNEAYIPATLERYWGFIREFPQQIQNKEFAQVFGQDLIIHFFFLGDIYSDTGDLKAKMAIRAAINRLLEREEIPENVRLLGCEFLKNEASSSALLEIERVVLRERADKCLK